MSSPVAASHIGVLDGGGESAEFFFDEDDDLFFNQSQGAPTATNNNIHSSTSSQQQSTTSTMSSFGMLALSYNDVSPISSSAAKRLGGSTSRPTSPTSNFDNTTPQVLNTSDAMNGIDQDDIELIQLDKHYLSILRNPNSSYHSVSKVCLALHQLLCSGNNEMSSISSTTTNNNNDDNTSNSIQIVSSAPIIQIQSHQLKIHKILTSLTHCLSTHTLPAVRILITSTLVTIAKSNYALLNYPQSINCTRLSSINNAITNLQDDCGVSLAYTLVSATLEQINDSVSCEALVSLGKLTLDICADSLLAEVRSIAECASIGGFVYPENQCSMLDKNHTEIMKLMSSKIYEFVIFPRMSSILHRVSLYTTSLSSNTSSTTSNASSIAKTLPILTATIIHALTKGKDTIPSRRSIQGNKSTHGKRGWRENDAISIAKEYVVNILLPFLDNSGGGAGGGEGGSEKIQRAISVALIRMSNACPLAQWRVMACRYASTVLLQQLNSEMGTSSSSSTGRQSPEKKGSQENDLLSSTLSSSMVPLETLAGTAALLVIGLRGIPLNERAPGLTAVLRATLLHLPMGMSVSSRCESLDLPIATDGNNQHYRLGRTGLLTEVVVSVLLDGSTNVGTRSILLQRILQSDQLSPIWDNGSSSFKDSSPVNELLWVLCTVATQVDTKCEGQIGLVILDFFAGVVCNPTTRQGSKKSTPFATASYAAYNTLFKAVLKRCGAFPPLALSISENMIPGNAGDKTSPTVVGGPGKQLHHDAASSLLKIATKIVFLRDKAKQNSSTVSAATEGDASLETSSHIVHLAALLVDTWLGCCIMNHDAKETNSKHLDMGLMFLPLCHSEVETLLKQHRSSTQDDSIVIATQLGQAFIACLENVACMSELLAHTNDESIREENVGPLVISMLEEVISSAKEENPSDSKRGSMLRYQIAMDANNAISRINKCIENLPKSYPEDIASAFQVSPLIGSANPKSLVSSYPEDDKSIDHCIQFMYNHARLVLSSRTGIALKAVAHSTAMSGVRRIHSRNPLRLKSTFTRSTIELYEKLPDLSILVPARSSSITENKAFTLTGSSDPVSLLLTHGMRRVRKGDSSGCIALVVTMRLFNITPVSIQNGVRLELRISQQSIHGQDTIYDSSASCVASSLYNNEIKPGDFVTWEVTLDGGAASTNLLLQPSVTFREVEQESTTHKWVSGAGGSIDVADDDEDDNNETTMDITLPCQSTSISSISSLVPCPLVFFASLNRCEANVGRGDTASFNLLWQGMKNQKTIPFDMNDQEVTNVIDKRGYVLLDKQTKGYAFMVPNGCRIFCTFQTSGGDVNTLCLRSDSSTLLETLVGTEGMQTAFVRFVLGETVSVASSTNGGKNKSPGKLQPDIGHDFPSLTMPGRTPVAV